MSLRTEKGIDIKASSSRRQLICEVVSRCTPYPCPCKLGSCSMCAGGLFPKKCKLVTVKANNKNRCRKSRTEVGLEVKSVKIKK